MESAGRSNAARNSSYLRKITILVVDNDPTSLAKISAMLQLWRYEVAAVNSSIGALCTLREHPTIDLVLTDVDMPEMDGFELLRHIKQEFEVPVIMMSSNGEDSVIQKCLSGGAVFFLVKPVNPYDLKNLWQYPAAKRGQSFVIDEIESTVTVGESSSAGSSSIGGIDENNNAKKVSKRKAPMNSNDDQEEETASARRKDKVVWTNSLHDKFLEAIRQIGPERVVPKKIHELMNVQGLTRQNVASHLQKYRNFLKDVAESSRFSSPAFAERVLRSSFASDHPLLLKTAQEYYMEVQQLQRMRGLKFQPGYAGIASAHIAASPGPILFPNQNASSSNSAQPCGYGQSSFLGNQANKRQMIPGNLNPLYHGNRLGYANGSNLSQNGGFSGGLINASNGLMNGVKSEHTYPQQIQARPLFYNAGSSSHFSFGSPSLHSSNSTLGTGIIGSTSTSPLGLNSSCTNNIIYAGSRLPTDGKLLGMDQTGLNSGYGPMTGTFNQNTNVAAMGNQTAAIKAEGEFSATGLDGYGSMTGTCNQIMNVAATGNQTSGIKAEREFSATGLDGAHQVSPAYTANQQAIASMLPGPGNGGATDYKSDHLMNNASNPDNITLTQQPGDSYFSDFLLVLKNYQQQVAGGGVQNPESANAMFREICSKLEEFLNSDFPESFSLDETGPWSEEALRKASLLFSRFPNKDPSSPFPPLPLPPPFLTSVGLADS
ncbi:hypothetical protein DITRI_Ditri04bG0183100 [Diplodiscus trichospermus]